MATNPMQRKARNSFILGVFLTLVITGVIIVFLFMQLNNKVKEEKARKASGIDIYVLNDNVKSGQIITEDMLIKKEKVDKDMVPSNASASADILSNFALQDKEGNDVVTRRVVEKSELEKTDKNKIKEGTATLCLKTANAEYELQQEDNGNYFIDKNSRILKDEPSGKYYVHRDQNEEDKKYIELNEVPVMAKVDMRKNTVLTTEFLAKGDNILKDDVRVQEYNMVVLPADLETGDYIDIRMILPSGQDFIVVAKKEVEMAEAEGESIGNTIWVNLDEEETLHMSCAIVDAFKIKGAKIYATKYTEAGMQKAAIPTYVLNSQTATLLKTDPNILQTAKDELNRRYNSDDIAKMRLEHIDKEIERQEDKITSKDNYEERMEESITNSRNARKEYLEAIATPPATTTTQTPPATKK